MKKFVSIILMGIMLMSFVSCQSQTPYIGENGNWWVGDQDLGVAAQAPQGESEKATFIPGKELTLPQGNSFKMYGRACIYGDWELGTSNFYETYEVEITSFKAVMLKEADINNIDDYCGQRVYFPYIYEIEISGKVDPKYSAMTTTMGVRFPQDGDLTFYDVVYFDNDPNFLGQFVTINSDGTFYLKTRVGYCSVQDTIMIVSLYSYGSLK